MEEKVMVILPKEVEQLAQNVSLEKKNEINQVLNQVFQGVAKMREQLDSVVVLNENDKVNMKLANTLRLGVRKVRLDAEKVFDAKREEVQQQMLSFKTEDSLWLKSKQVMQIMTKEIEEIARWKEETRERFDKEQKELQTQKRILQVSVFNAEIARSEFENMSDETFHIFLDGIEKAYKEKKEAESERLAAIEAERVERERIKAENERLQKEAEAKEKQLADERAKAAAERKAIEERARKEREESERILLTERKLAAEKLEIEMANARKLATEIEAKKQAEETARKEAEEKIIAEQKAKLEAEEKEKNASDKVKLTSLIFQIENIIYPEIKNNTSLLILNFIKLELKRTILFAKEKIEKL